MTSTTLDFTADSITSLNTLAHSVGACESRDSTEQQPLGYACLRVEGVDAAAFLQGQMTADVGAQSVGKCVVSALCNPKGRVIASMDIARFSDALFGLILANHLVDVVKTTLSRYILRSKLTITPWPEQPLVTLAQHTKASTTQDCGLLVNNRFYCRTAWMRDCGANWILTNVTSDSSDSDTDRDLTWSQAHVLFGIAPPAQATELQHIPQMLNLDALGGVSMTKGCYTGQEIIARVHHKGRVKRRLRRFTAPANVPIALGDPIANAAGGNAGMVVEVATDDHDRTGILAVVKESDFSDDAPLTCGDAPLEHWSLPYTV